MPYCTSFFLFQFLEIAREGIISWGILSHRSVWIKLCCVAVRKWHLLLYSFIFSPSSSSSSPSLSFSFYYTSRILALFSLISSPLLFFTLLFYSHLFSSTLLFYSHLFSSTLLYSSPLIYSPTIFVLSAYSFVLPYYYLLKCSLTCSYYQLFFLLLYNICNNGYILTCACVYVYVQILLCVCLSVSV